MKTKTNIIPKFKIGDKVLLINGQTARIISPCSNNYYIVNIPYENRNVKIFASDMQLIINLQQQSNLN